MTCISQEYKRPHLFFCLFVCFWCRKYLLFLRNRLHHLKFEVLAVEVQPNIAALLWLIVRISGISEVCMLHGMLGVAGMVS